MSHIAKIEIEIKDLEILKKVCRRLGLEFKENQKTYKWYGTWVGDSPLPDSITKDQLGKCDHAIRVPGCEYEVGVVSRKNHFILLWDSWQRGGLEKRLGKNAGFLRQAYAVERVRAEARRKGYRLTERQMDNGVRLVLSV